MKSRLLAATTLLIAFLGSPVLADELPKIPSDVAWIYVFFQDPSSVARGSGEEVATMLTPSEFLGSFASYKSQAKSQNRQFIVTAQAKQGTWVQEQIFYRGKRLLAARYYSPSMDKVYPGAEIPLD